jgi:hypothetical protein
MVSMRDGTITLRAFGWPSSSENAAPRACRVKPHPFGTAAGVFDFGHKCRSFSSVPPVPKSDEHS